MARTTNTNKKGYTANILSLIQEKQQATGCCLDFLTQVFTEDSDTVTFTGDGTQSNPIIATSTGATGTVTSVGLTSNPLFNITNSPITTAGDINLDLNTQAAHLVLSGPATGTAIPTFRALVATDIPSLSGLYINNQTTQQAAANFNISGGGTFGNTTSISKNNSGTDATPHLLINGTWNTTGNPTLINATITNTASGAGALLMDLRANNIGRFRISAGGSLFLGTSVTYFQTIPISVASGGDSGPSGQSTCLAILSSYQQAIGSVQQNAIGIQDSISPTGGSSDAVALFIQSNINQTGTATGNVRGIFYSPSITAMLGRNIAWQNTTGDALFATTSGNVSIAKVFNDVPTARLHVGGSSTGNPGTGSVKIDSGTLLTTPEDGTLEYDGINLFFTVGAVRKQVTLV